MSVANITIYYYFQKMATIQNSNSSDEKGSHNEQCGVPSSSTGTSQTLMDPDQSNKPSAISPNMWQVSSGRSQVWIFVNQNRP